MPMYGYRCGACGYGYERYAAAQEGRGKAEKCPKCGKSSFEKVFSTFSSNCCGGGGEVSMPSSGGCGGGGGHFS